MVLVLFLKVLDYVEVFETRKVVEPGIICFAFTKTPPDQIYQLADLVDEFTAKAIPG
jgi:hypothetical protein